MILVPATDYRYSLKKGMSGTDVAALQINLGVAVDGEFGPETKRAVVSFQKDSNLLDDGICGPATMQKFCVTRSNPAARQFELPKGLLRSLLSNESNFNLGAVSYHPSDSGLDVGAYQKSTGATPGTQELYRAAYSVADMALETAERIKDRHDSFVLTDTGRNSKYYQDLSDGDPDKFRWLMAVLTHNWPDAAEDIPRFGVIYEFEPGRDDAPADWIITATKGRLSTPREWVYSYVYRATVYVRW